MTATDPKRTLDEQRRGKHNELNLRVRFLGPDAQQLYAAVQNDGQHKKYEQGD